jgi:hypothetical protein
MNSQKCKAVWMGLLGLILAVLGIKYALTLAASASQPFNLEGRPVIFFFSIDDPCECMVDLTQRAESQIAGWPVERRGGVQVVRFPIQQRRDLEAKYKVFRVPSLILVDAQNQVIWRQDYPLNEGGPFNLDEFEAVIANFGEDNAKP